MYEPEFLASLMPLTNIPSYEVIDIATYDRNNYLRDVDPISSGLPFFDDLNLSRGDFMVMYARLKSYKTFTLLLLGYKLFLAGERVYIYSLELAAREVLQRLDSMLGKINPAWFRKGMFNQDRSEVLDTLSMLNKLAAEASMTGYVKIRDGGASVASVVAEIESLPENERPTVILIDAMEQMSAKVSDSSAKSISLGDVAYSLKQIAVAYNLLVLATTQANRNAAQKDDADATTVAGSDIIARAVDVLLYGQIVNIDLPDINGNPQAYSKWSVAAARHGVDRYEAYITFNFNKGSVTIHRSIEAAEASNAFDESQPKMPPPPAVPDDGIKFRQVMV